MDINGYDFGLLLKNLREHANLTQKQLGNKIGVSEGMISRYENNMSEPPFEKIRDFAVIFNVSMDYLAGMEKKNTLPLRGLTEEQVSIMIHLAELFGTQNSYHISKLSPEQCEIIGQIVENFIKTN